MKSALRHVFALAAFAVAFAAHYAVTRLDAPEPEQAMRVSQPGSPIELTGEVIPAEEGDGWHCLDEGTCVMADIEFVPGAHAQTPESPSFDLTRSLVRIAYPDGGINEPSCKVADAGVTRIRCPTGTKSVIIQPALGDSRYVVVGPAELEKGRGIRVTGDQTVIVAGGIVFCQTISPTQGNTASNPIALCLR